MPPKEPMELDPLEQSIKNYQQIKYALLQNISKLKIDSRKETIKLNYNENLENMAKWYVELSKKEFKSEKLKDITTGKGDQSEILITEYLKQIEEKPEHKKDLIRQFLEHIIDIEETDRLVLLDNFYNLDINALENEFKNLTLIFDIK